MMFAMTRALDRYIIDEPSASLRSSSSEGHGESPNHVIELWLAPMWKLTESFSSLSTSHSGSHTRSPRSGRPRFCGSLHIVMPWKPDAAARCASATDPSMSHH